VEDGRTGVHQEAVALKQLLYFVTDIFIVSKLELHQGNTAALDVGGWTAVRSSARWGRGHQREGGCGTEGERWGLLAKFEKAQIMTVGYYTVTITQRSGEAKEQYR
jgi:hypothetical protein